MHVLISKVFTLTLNSVKREIVLNKYENSLHYFLLLLTYKHLVVVLLFIHLTFVVSVCGACERLLSSFPRCVEGERTARSVKGHGRDTQGLHQWNVVNISDLADEVGMVAAIRPKHSAVLRRDHVTDRDVRNLRARGITRHVPVVDGNVHVGASVELRFREPAIGGKVWVELCPLLQVCLLSDSVEGIKRELWVAKDITVELILFF